MSKRIQVHKRRVSRGVERSTSKREVKRLTETPIGKSVK